MNQSYNQSSVITFVGGGNMATALIRGLMDRGLHPENIFVIDSSPQALIRIEADYGVRTVAEPLVDKSWCSSSSLVVWAVKPQHMRSVCESLSNVSKDLLHLSVAAGITSGSFSKWLGTKRVVRAMPNTPALIGMGQTALFAAPEISQIERARIETVVKGCGEFLWLEDERLLDVVTAVSGSGPAYVFYLLEALTQAGEDLGLTDEQARKLAIGTFIGASHLAQQSSDSLSTLRENVTSKGGTTEAALSHLNTKNIGLEFQNAVKIAFIKSQQLGAEYGK
jgi:pyrroline-5-carboxylate reductase